MKNISEVLGDSDSLLAKLKELPEGEREDMISGLGLATGMVSVCADRLESEIEALQEYLTVEKRKLRHHGTHNSMGIIQTRGVLIDKLCAQLEDRKDGLEIVIRLIERQLEA